MKSKWNLANGVNGNVSVGKMLSKIILKSINRDTISDFSSFLFWQIMCFTLVSVLFLLFFWHTHFLFRLIFWKHLKFFLICSLIYLTFFCLSFKVTSNKPYHKRANNFHYRVALKQQITQSKKYTWMIWILLLKRITLSEKLNGNEKAFGRYKGTIFSPRMLPLS